MKSYSKYFLFLIVLVFVSACKKNDDSPTEPSVSKKEILTSTTWLIASDSQTGQAGAKVKFNTTGKMDATYGSTTVTSNWTLNSDESQLSVSTVYMGISINITYKFQSCTKDQVILIITSSDDNGKNLKLNKTS